MRSEVSTTLLINCYRYRN